MTFLKRLGTILAKGVAIAAGVGPMVRPFLGSGKAGQIEEAAINDYQEAMKADLPLDVQYVVKRQYMDIKDAFDRIRILQRAA